MMEQSALKAVLLLVAVLSWPARRQPPTVELMGFVVEGLPDLWNMGSKVGDETLLEMWRGRGIAC